MNMNNKKWIQKANIKEGSLSRQLGIPERENIPKELLIKIKNAKTGTHIENPTKKGHKTIPVTKKLKKRANLALTLKELAKKRKKR